MGQAQAWEAWRKMRRGLGKQVEVEGAGTVKSDKSRLFEIENKSGHNNYFGRKMRNLVNFEGLVAHLAEVIQSGS